LTCPALALLIATAAWILTATPALLEQRGRSEQLENIVRGKSREEAAATLDNPAVPVTQAVAAAVPERSCVLLLAYAGPAAIDYYNARFDYLLYPRRVAVQADSRFELGDCEYLAVFRDTPSNLATEPFAGSWDENELQQALAGFERVDAGQAVKIYRRGGR
jgi:hypothetical protein